MLPFDFPLAGDILNSLQAESATSIAAGLDKVAVTYPAGAGDAPFLTNHDQQRVATALGNDPTLLRLAAAILLTLQGTPFVYYGEEPRDAERAGHRRQVQADAHALGRDAGAWVHFG